MTTTKKILTLKVILAVTVILTASLFAISAYADTRSAPSRDRSDATGRLTDPVTPLPPPVVPKPPAQTGGGIQNSTGGTANSGGNQGGNVATGDESVEMTVVNVGPTNTPTVIIVTPPEDDPQPDPQCETDARGRTTCPPDVGGRAR